MNCREAEIQIGDERDGPLSPDARAALDQHLAGCAACRRQRETLETAFSHLRLHTRDAVAPDPEKEWQELRRTIRGGASARAQPAGTGRLRAWWFAVPLAAAAAVVVALQINSGLSPESRFTRVTDGAVARASASDNSGGSASTVVFVDEKSGWTFVVAPGDAHQG